MEDTSPKDYKSAKEEYFLRRGISPLFIAKSSPCADEREGLRYFYFET